MYICRKIKLTPLADMLEDVGGHRSVTISRPGLATAAKRSILMNPPDSARDISAMEISLNKTTTEDSSWREEGSKPDLNVSILPGTTPVTDHSVAEEQEIAGFNFSLCCLTEVGKIEPELTGVSSSRGKQRTLESPDSVALLPSLGLVMVSEPSRDRIGVYGSSDLKFYDWFQYPINPFNRKKRSFVKPTSLLAMGDILVITDSQELVVFSIADLACTIVFSKPGSFQGLASSTEDEGKFFTVSKEGQNPSFLLSFQREKGNNWKICHKIPVSEAQTGSAIIRFLIEKDNKIYLTDAASHHLIQVDLKTGDQKVGGYRGHNTGQIYQPGHLLSDDAGNLLLCDSGNHRLLVFSGRMAFIKVRILIIPPNCSVLEMLSSAGDGYVIPAASSQHSEAGEVRVRGVPGPRRPPASCRQVQAERSRPGERGDYAHLQ